MDILGIDDVVVNVSNQVRCFVYFNHHLALAFALDRVDGAISGAGCEIYLASGFDIKVTDKGFGQICGNGSGLVRDIAAGIGSDFFVG